MKKKLVITIAVGAALMSAYAPMSVSAEDAKPTADASVSLYSKYVWRGFELSKDSMVIQPSVTVGYKGAAINLWGNIDTDTDPALLSGDEPAGTGFDANEIDTTLSYDWSMGPVGLGAGYILYSLDGVGDTQELYLSASLDTLLAPSVTIYRDIDALPGWYVSLGISHSVALNDKYSLDLGAQVGYLNADDATSYAEVKNPTEAYSGLLDGLISASISIPINDYMSVTPEVYYSFAAGGDAEDLLKAASVDGSDSNFVYGGISASFAF